MYTKAHKRDTFKAVRRARWSYVNDILQLSLDSGDSKPFWKYIKSQRQDSVGVSPLKSGGRLFSDSLDKAEILNTQFISVFTKEDSSFIPKLFGPNYPTIDPLIINQNGVEKLLSGLNPSKAAGPDQIPCRILKELSVELAPIFAALFRQSLNTGALPSLWSQAFVSPIYKKGPRCMPENYRPVSLTCVSCKLFEYILCRHIRNHLDRHGILTPLKLGKPTARLTSHGDSNCLGLRPNTRYPYEARGMDSHISLLNTTKTTTLTAMWFRMHIVDIVNVHVSNWRDEIPNGCWATKA